LSTRHQIWLGEFDLTRLGHTEDLKTVRAAYPASCLPLLPRCKVHMPGVIDSLTVQHSAWRWPRGSRRKH